MNAVAVSIDLGPERAVSGQLCAPADAVACLVLAHGAGAGMRHPFMENVTGGLAKRRIATLRYQFPFMEAGSKRPDRAPLAQATVRAAVEAAAGLLPGTPLIAGGKSFGARMTSQAQAETPLTGVRALVFFGFPLHPAGRPSIDRADHLADVELPMLFLQGTRDPLADQALMASVVEELGARSTLCIVEDADHSFHVRVRSGRTDADAMTDLLDAVHAFVVRVLEP